MKTILFLALLLFSFQAKENPIKHIVVLGMENHSYDNMLGFLEAPIGDLNENTYCNKVDGNEYCTSKGADFMTLPGPSHGFSSMNKQIFGTENFPSGSVSMEEETMGGFAYIQSINTDRAQGEPQQVMDCYSPEQLPVISELARQFKTTKNWFSPLPSATDPNKMFYHTATSNGNTGNCKDWYCSGYPMAARSIQQNLQDEGYSWSIHWQDWNESLAIYPLNQSFKNQVYDSDFEKFYQKIEDNELDNYTFLIPRIYWDEIPDDASKNDPKYTMHAPNTQHPDEDVRSGELLIKKVYETIRNSDYWENTLLVITYDECGGFFDHVPPPQFRPKPTPELESGPDDFDFTRLGTRVPGIIISPWLAKGVDEKIYDHSAVPKTIKDIFDLQSPYLTKRDEHSKSFFTESEILDQPRKDCPTELPSPISFEEMPIQHQLDTEFTGTIKNQVYLIGSMMLKSNLLKEQQYLDILSKLKNIQQGKQFLHEMLEVLGYMPQTEKPFKYISRDIKNLIKQKKIE